MGLTPPGRASQIYVWDIKIGSIVKHLDLPGTLFNEVQISTNGRLVLATPYDRFLYGFDFNRAKSVEFRPEQQLGKIKNFSISPDGHHVAIAVGSWLYIWEPESGSILAKLDIKPDRLSHGGLSFSPDGSRVVYKPVGGESYLAIWDWKLGNAAQRVKLKETNGGLAIDPKAQIIASIERRKLSDFVRLYDFDTLKIVRDINADEWKKTANFYISSMAFTPDGKRFAVATNQGNVQMFDIETGVEIFRAKAAEFSVHQIGFTNDGKTLLTNESDKRPKGWDVSAIPPGNLFEIACKKLPDKNLNEIDEGRLSIPEPICKEHP